MIVRFAWVLLVLTIAFLVGMQTDVWPFDRIKPRSATNALSGPNLALHRPYVLDPPPNYATPVAAKTTVLTDGRLGKDAHWVRGASHGWTRLSPVTAVIELAAMAPIQEVRVHVTRSKAVGIEWPGGAHLFVSTDAKSYRALLTPGSLVPTTPDTHTIERGYFRFMLDGVSAVKVAVAAFGTPLIFLDEIEVFGMAHGARATPQRLGPAFDRDRLKEAVRVARIDGVLTTVKARLAEASRLPEAVASATAAPWLFRKAPTGTGGACTAQRIWPWQSFRLGSPAVQPMPTGWAGGDVALAGRPTWLAWQVANHASSPTVLTVQGEAADWHVLGYLPTPSPEIVGDLLLPMPASVSIPPGESLTLFLRVPPRPAGEAALDPSLDCSGQSLEMKARLWTLEDDHAAKPGHFTVWGYPVSEVKAALTCRPGFVRDFGIDTDTIFPAALGDLSKPEITRDLVEQLTASRGAARALLFVNIKDHPVFRKGADPFAVQEAARRWLLQLRDAIRTSGFEGEALLYLVDEIRPEDVDWFNRIAQTLRVDGPDANGAAGRLRLFGTIDSASVAGVVKDLDVASINILASIGDRDELKSSEFYLAEGPAKELSPSRYYFAAPIGAAVRGAPGFGIWALSDSSGASAHQQAWSDIGIGERDFGMLYFDAKQCPMPSLRLAAVGSGRATEQILRNCWARHPPTDATRRGLQSFGRMSEARGKDLGDDALTPLLAELDRCADLAALRQAASPRTSGQSPEARSAR